MIRKKSNARAYNTFVNWYLLFKLYDVYIYIKERKVHVIIRKEIFPSK